MAPRYTPKEDGYEKRLAFARTLGYTSLAEAFAHVNKWDFKKQYEQAQKKSKKIKS